MLTLDKQNALNFQLLGGVWILQTLPSIVFGLFTRWFHRWALLIGWAVGMVYGTVVAYGYCTPAARGRSPIALAVVPLLGGAGYIGLTRSCHCGCRRALTAVFRALKVGNGIDITKQSDYFADIGDPASSRW